MPRRLVESGRRGDRPRGSALVGRPSSPGRAAALSRRGLTASLVVALGVLWGSASRATPQEGQLSVWIDELRAASPFDARRAAAELRKLGEGAIAPMAQALLDSTAWRDVEPRHWFVLEALLDEMLVGFLDHLESEYGALQLDRLDLADLKRQEEQLAEWKQLEEQVSRWKTEIPEFVDKATAWIELERARARTAARSEDDEPNVRDERTIRDLSPRVAAIDAAHPEFAAKARAFARLVELSAASSQLVRSAGEVAQLRLQDLEQRTREREPRVDALLEQLEALGLPAWNVVVARREGLPLETRPVDDALRSPVGALYEALIASWLDRLGAQGAAGLVSPGSTPVPERYLRALLWAEELERAGPHAKAADLALGAHVEATLADLESPESPIRDRAALELWRLGRRGLAALEGGDEPRPEHEFLAELIRWRVEPRVYARVGIHFAEYRELSFAARRRKIFQFARTAGQGAIPTLRSLIVDDRLEPSILVKYAAAKALLAQLDDRTGFLWLQREHPELTLRQPAVSRDLLLLQGLAYVQSKDYARAVEEFRKILNEFPFDFEGNYHLAFTYLLLKDFERAIHYFEIARRIHPDDQLTLYNLACSYSLAGKSEKALEALEASVDAGFDDPTHMDNDTDLDPIRTQPGFEEIRRKCADRAEGA